MVNVMNHDVSGEYKGFKYIADYVTDDDKKQWLYEIYDAADKNVTELLGSHIFPVGCCNLTDSLKHTAIASRVEFHIRHTIDRFISAHILKATQFPSPYTGGKMWGPDGEIKHEGIKELSAIPDGLNSILDLPAPFPQFTPEEQQLINFIIENTRDEFLKKAHEHQDNVKFDRAERAFQKTHELDQILLKLNDIFERQEHV